MRLIGPGSEHQAIMEWLCPVDPNVTRKSIDRTRMPGTGTWFTQSDELRKQSKSEESSCLWLNGISKSRHSTSSQSHLKILTGLTFTDISNDRSRSWEDYFAVSDGAATAFLIVNQASQNRRHR